ncbi:uncharacterized protein TNCV_795811 [Trichonephila clavipes]|nr:uncharacterized protein TNCV_795811 [Trichonephila clavipes]
MHQIVRLTNHNSAIQTTQDFTAETVCKKNSDSVATPSCHVRPTNQDIYSQAGPPTSGHIHYLHMGWRNASRSVSQIVGRLECGRTQLEISEELGIAQSVISRLWQRFQDDGNVSRCYSTGGPRVTMTNEDRYLAVTAKRNRRSTASDLSRQLSSATGTTVSRQTVYRRLGSDLHVQSVTMTGHIYRDVILEQQVRLFRGAMGAEFLFMDDNARPHRANIVDECLQSEDITRMDRPA